MAAFGAFLMGREVAKKMVIEASKAGAECIKHQTHFVEDEMTIEAKNIYPPNANISIWDVIEQNSLSKSDEKSLIKTIKLQKFSDSIITMETNKRS